MRIRLESVVRAARCKAPFTAVTWSDDGDGTHGKLVVPSKLLRAVMTCEFLNRAYSESVEDKLALRLIGRNGHRSADYRLLCVQAQAWQVGDEQRKWAESARKRESGRKARQAAVAAGMDAKTAAVLRRWREELGKLERRRAKMREPRVPVGPMVAHPHGHLSGGDTERAMELAWRAEKPVRRALSVYIGRALYGKTGCTWAEFYRRVGVVVGRYIADKQEHSGVTRLTRGPSRDEYFRRIYKYIGMSERPWSRSEYRQRNPYALQGYGEHHDKNDFEVHRIAQWEYLQERAAWRELGEEIAQAKREIAELERGGEHVEEMR